VVHVDLGSNYNLVDWNMKMLQVNRTRILDDLHNITYGCVQGKIYSRHVFKASILHFQTFLAKGDQKIPANRNNMQ